MPSVPMIALKAGIDPFEKGLRQLQFLPEVVAKQGQERESSIPFTERHVTQGTTGGVGGNVCVDECRSACVT